MKKSKRRASLLEEEVRQRRSNEAALAAEVERLRLELRTARDEQAAAQRMAEVCPI